MSQVARQKLEELIGQYWDLGFTEGKTGVNQADAANKVLHDIRELLSSPFERWLVVFEDGGEVVRKTLQEAKQTVEDHGRGGLIVPLAPTSSAVSAMTQEDAVRVIEALCCYVEARVAKARKRQHSSDSAEIQTAIERADYVLSYATALAAKLAAGPNTHLGIDSAGAQAAIQEALWPYLRDGVGYEASDAVIEVLKELEKTPC